MHLSQLAPQKCGRCSASTFVVVANGEVSLRYLFMQESCRTVSDRKSTFTEDVIGSLHATR
jgi:hypothetical protein